MRRSFKTPNQVSIVSIPILIFQQIAFKNLVERNKEREKVEGGPPAPNSAIQLPFIIVNTSKTTEIDCRISDNKVKQLTGFRRISLFTWLD